MMSEEEILFWPGGDEGIEVIAGYKRASGLMPGDAQMHFDYGLTFMELGAGLGSCAIEALKVAARLRPYWAAAHSQLGLAYAAADRREEAIEAYKQALALRPGDLDTLCALAHVCLLLERYREAEQVAASMVTLAPLMSGSHFVLGLGQLLTGCYAESSESFHRAIQLEPDLSEARFGLGLASISLGNDRLAQVQCAALRDLDQELGRKLALHRRRGTFTAAEIMRYFFDAAIGESCK